MSPGGEDLFRLFEACVRRSVEHPECEAFFCSIQPLLKRIAGRVSRQFAMEAELEDIVQDICLKMIQSRKSLFETLPQHEPETTAYISVVAANCARDFFRSRNAAKRGSGRLLQLDEAVDQIAAPLGVFEPIEHEVLAREIEDLLPQRRREQIIFRLYYRQGFTTKEIAAIPALELNVKGVESLIHRTMSQVRRRLQSRLPHTRQRKSAAERVDIRGNG